MASFGTSSETRSPSVMRLMSLLSRSGGIARNVGFEDEMSPRAFSDYTGGTAEQNRHRAILRKAMEDEGFNVNPKEWWHFDYKDWKRYRIGNVDFQNIK